MDSASQHCESPLIRLSGLSLGFGGHRLLSDADASIMPGQLVALLGRNGSGKSTLLRAMAGLNRNYSGNITVGGLEQRTLGAAARARLMSFVGTGRARVGHFTCYDLVALGRSPYTNWIGSLTDNDRRAVHQALEAVGMADYAHRQLDSLSDGECQRVMIARALAQDTPLILLDEPTSFLDIPNRYGLVRLLASLAHGQGKCIIYSTHELDIALELSDSIILIDPPRLVCGLPGAIRNEITKTFGL